MRVKRFLPIVMILLLLLSACGEQSQKEEIQLDLDQIAMSLSNCGYFPDSLETVDPGFVPGQLSLYEDRIEATLEDLVDARYYAAVIGVTADQFILLEGGDSDAAERLEKALETYAEDQKSSFEFYLPDQAARLDDPIIERQGKYLLFAIGEDQKSLADLCSRLMNGEQIEFEVSPQDEEPDSTQSQVSTLSQSSTVASTVTNDKAIADPEHSQDDAAQSEESDTLSSSDVEASHQTALNYYAGTVFEIQSLTKIEISSGWQGEIMFQVVCSKGGESQVDRKIALERQDGIWIVVNEGY